MLHECHDSCCTLHTGSYGLYFHTSFSTLSLCLNVCMCAGMFKVSVIFEEYCMFKLFTDIIQIDGNKTMIGN